MEQVCVTCRRASCKNVSTCHRLLVIVPEKHYGILGSALSHSPNAPYSIGGILHHGNMVMSMMLSHRQPPPEKQFFVKNKYIYIYMYIYIYTYIHTHTHT